MAMAILVEYVCIVKVPNNTGAVEHGYDHFGLIYGLANSNPVLLLSLTIWTCHVFHCFCLASNFLYVHEFVASGLCVAAQQVFQYVASLSRFFGLQINKTVIWMQFWSEVGN